MEWPPELAAGMEIGALGDGGHSCQWWEHTNPELLPPVPHRTNLCDFTRMQPEKPPLVLLHCMPSFGRDPFALFLTGEQK